MTYMWVFSGNMITSPILEVKGKIPIIPRSLQTSARRELHFLMNHPNPGPWRALQGKGTKATFPGPAASHIMEEEMPLFYRWFEDTCQLSFSIFPYSLVVLHPVTRRARRLQLLSSVMSFQRSLCKKTLTGKVNQTEGELTEIPMKKWPSKARIPIRGIIVS